MSGPNHADVFETARAGLLGLAYRILGSLADAEDAVQDTWLKWSAADRDAILNPSAWLTTTCSRRCLDLLRSAHRKRVDYVGAWLPEPVQTAVAAEAEDAALTASSLSMAFLMMLERLTPKERAAYLLHEIFDQSYSETAETLGIREATCRKLVSRARANIEAARVRHVTPVERQEQLLAAFQTAVTTGATRRLADLLSDDIALAADGGGKVPALQRVLRGRAEVLEFVGKALVRFWVGAEWTRANINGSRGFVLRRDGATMAAVSFAYDEVGRLTDVFIVRNPDKLEALDAAAIH